MLVISDSIDTKSTMDVMRELITSANVYLDTKRKNNQIPERFVLKNIAAYITRMLRVNVIQFVNQPIQLFKTVMLVYWKLAYSSFFSFEKLRSFCLLLLLLTPDIFRFQIFGAIEDEELIGFPTASSQGGTNVSPIELISYTFVRSIQDTSGFLLHLYFLLQILKHLIHCE